MPDVVIHIRRTHADADLRRLLAATEQQNGYRRVESITYDIDAAIQAIEAGHAKSLLVVDPRVLGQRRDEIERRVASAGGIVEYARSGPRRAGDSDWQRHRAAAVEHLHEIQRRAAEALRALEDPHSRA